MDEPLGTESLASSAWAGEADGKEKQLGQALEEENDRLVEDICARERSISVVGTCSYTWKYETIETAL